MEGIQDTPAAKRFNDFLAQLEVDLWARGLKGESESDLRMALTQIIAASLL